MNELLTNIFVSLEVAKLAKEKGFNEWCACYKEQKYTESANVRDDLGWYYGKRKNIIPIPAHYQLIEWLALNHATTVSRAYTGAYIVFRGWDVSKYLPINEAFLYALNLIE